MEVELLSEVGVESLPICQATLGLGQMQSEAGSMGQARHLWKPQFLLEEEASLQRPVGKPRSFMNADSGDCLMVYAKQSPAHRPVAVSVLIWACLPCRHQLWQGGHAGDQKTPRNTGH